MTESLRNLWDVWVHNSAENKFELFLSGRIRLSLFLNHWTEKLRQKIDNVESVLVMWRTKKISNLFNMEKSII